MRHYPTPAELRQVDLQTLTGDLELVSSRRVGAKRADRLKGAAEASGRVPDGLVGVQLRLQGHLEEVASWKARIERTEAEMARALQQASYAPSLLSISGVGIVTAGSFLGEIGDRGQHSDWRQIQKLAELNLLEYCSGKHRGQQIFSKRDRGSLRAFLYRTALTPISKNSVSRAFC